MANPTCTFPAVAVIGNPEDKYVTFLNSFDYTAGSLTTSLGTPMQLYLYQTVRKEQIAGYLQDEWKATRNFTINYGVCYDYFSPFHEQHNNADPFDLVDCSAYCGIRAEFYHNNFPDFDPRVGFAYSPDSLGGKTVFRVSFGMYHGEDQLGDEDSPVVNTEPSSTLTSGKQSNGSSVQYRYPTPPALAPLTGLALTPRSMARHHPDSYTEQWTGSVQQALGADTVLTMTYLGVKGNHLFRHSYTNLIDPLTGTRPFPECPSEIDTKYNEGMSIFNALQINLNRRFHNGFFIAGNYMLSHALNDGSVGAGEADAAENVNCFRCEYGNSDDDVRHTGNMSLVYDMPIGIGRRYFNSSHLADTFIGGWSANTLLTARSGLPLNVTLSRSALALPHANNVDQRPNRVVGQPIYLGGRGVHSWLNPAAFSVPAAGTWGNLARNSATGPALWQDDSTLEKTLHVTERNAFIFRAEAFNLFNRAQYGTPGTALNVGAGNVISPTATFGRITSAVNPTGLVGTGTPRELEFSLRITY